MRALPPTRMRDGEGRLLRTWKEGEAKILAFLEDEAYFALALLDLADAEPEKGEARSWPARPAASSRGCGAASPAGRPRLHLHRGGERAAPREDAGPLRQGDPLRPRRGGARALPARPAGRRRRPRGRGPTAVEEVSGLMERPRTGPSRGTSPGRSSGRAASSEAHADRTDEEGQRRGGGGDGPAPEPAGGRSVSPPPSPPTASPRARCSKCGSPSSWTRGGRSRARSRSWSRPGAGPTCAAPRSSFPRAGPCATRTARPSRATRGAST